MAKQRFSMCLVCVVGLLMCVTAGAGGKGGIEAGEQDIAIRAFNLRMGGHVDEARAILEKAVLRDPGNAMAQYELARVAYHIGFGNPRELESMLERSQICIEKAVGAAPDNVAFRAFSGQIAVMRGYFQMEAHGDNAAAKVQFAKACAEFKAAVRLKADYKEAMLYLVELYGDLPAEAGGDRVVAEEYATKLEAVDAVFAAKADAVLSPKGAAFWQDILASNVDNTEVLGELGKAYLQSNNVDDAVLCFEKAVKSDPQRAYLFLDLSIYHTFSAMQAGENKGLFSKSVASGDVAVGRYLDSGPVGPMRGYAIGIRSKYRSFSGDKEQGQALYKQAEALDPYFSKATGCPIPELYIRPGTISRRHRYLMRPF